MKTESCGCPGKSNCIVITIETCCKKTCEGNQKSNEVAQKGSEDKAVEVERVSSGPLITEKVSSDDLVVEKLSSGAVIVSKSSDRVKRNQSSGTIRSVREEPRKDNSGVVIVPREENIERKQFKLPLLVERHHGPGCAMEISVLEKHEESCVYRKEDTEGRNVDDRVGSYDCIGRLVFRTCNSNELDSESSRTGSGDKKPLVVTVSSQENIEKQPSPQSSRRSSASEQGSFQSAGNIQGSKISQSSRSKNKSAESGVKEEPAIAKEESLNFASPKTKRKKSRSEQIMIAATTPLPNPAVYETTDKLMPLGRSSHSGVKKHYPGDGCKLHPPKNPFIFGSGKLLQQVSASKKTFPVYTDEANQTDLNTDTEEPPKMRFSQETITSLTDVSKTEGKRKSNFLGSLFRRNSAGRPGSTDSKKQFK